MKSKISIHEADEHDREEIYTSRHDVYAIELGQYPVNHRKSLSTPLDDLNRYVVARINGRLAGYISITPPEAKKYSIDSYLPRNNWPFPADEGLYELRVLTVVGESRGSLIASALMYSALRWVEAAGGNRIMAIGRSDISSMYRNVGLCDHGITVSRGAVDFQLMSNTVSSIRERICNWGRLLLRIEENIDWGLDIPFKKPAACFHGGDFFNSIGVEFTSLDNREKIINADVLDAWFAPAPEVINSLTDHLPWLVKTSPPVGCEGLVKTIARVREIAAHNIVVGAGSSDLIFMAFQHWLHSKSRVLMLDPTYGEYDHVCSQVIGCEVERFTLKKEENFRVDTDLLVKTISKNKIDLVVLVNPNSPTGQHVDIASLKRVIREAPPSTVFWIDETYIEYAGEGQSLEKFAAKYPGVVVCKSMSKAYALSGVRVAYLCAKSETLEALRSLTPPWAVSLPGQVAGVKALLNDGYYRGQYEYTKELRATMVSALEDIGVWCVPGVANFILAYLPSDGPTAAEVVGFCREQNVYLRDATNMGSTLSQYALRIAVKSPADNIKIIKAITESITNRSQLKSGFPVSQKKGKVSSVHIS